MLTLSLCASIALVLANFFFVASEFALVKVRRTRLTALVAQGSRRARIALHIAQRLDVYLSANQLGITLASLGLGWLGEPAFASLLAPHLAGLGAWAGVTTHGLAAALALALITIVHVVIGELVPKSLALARAESVALLTAVPLHVFYVATLPLTWSLNAVAQLLVRALRLRGATDDERGRSPEELRLVLAQVNLDPRARGLIDRIFDYTQRKARQVMTMRRDVVVLKVDDSFSDNLKKAVAHQFTRYPVVDASDHVCGYVHIKDMTAALVAGKSDVTMREVIRQPVYASEDDGLEGLRREFEDRAVHLAVIRGTDEAFLGVVTLEDLLEEFVGEIRDEQDAAEVAPIVRGGQGFEIDSRLTLDVAHRELGLRLDDVPRAVETVGDYLASRLPVVSKGAFIDAGGYRLTVVEMRGRRLHRVRGERHAQL